PAEVFGQRHFDLVRPAGSYWEFQGTRSPLAGRYVIESPERFMGEMVHSLVAVNQGTLGFTQAKVWGREGDDWAFMEWVSHARLVNGTDFRNHGLTLLAFDDQGRNIAHREYLNTAYLEATWGDWRPLVPGEIFAALPCAGTYDDAPDTWVPH